MLYLDNAATTHYKPQCVVDATVKAITEAYNPNRSGHRKALELQQQILNTRSKISALFNNDSEMHTAFSLNCTSALNLAIMGNVRKKGHIISSVTEHNSVLRPLMQLQRLKLAEVTLIQPDSHGEITQDALYRALRPDTYMAVFSHVSNVTGKAQDLKKFGEVLQNKGIVFVADCAQSAGYILTDMTKQGINAAAFPAHKGLHGIQGLGVLVFDKTALPRPLILGGTGTDSHLLTQPETLPESLEAGTLPCPAIMALQAAIDWWVSERKQTREKMGELNRIMTDGLNAIANVEVYSDYNESGIACFNIKGQDSTVVGDALAEKFDIVTRSGLHCAPLMHKWLNTYDTGAVRASIACDTTSEQVYRFLNCVQYLAKTL